MSAKGPAIAAAKVAPVVDEGLGNSSYLVHLGDGRALVVDLPRDLRAVRSSVGRQGLVIAFAAPTRTCSRLPAARIDVRQQPECAGGHLPGAANTDSACSPPGLTAWQPGGSSPLCEHGERAVTAARLLERAGRAAAAVPPGGPADWASAAGQAPENVQ